MAAQPRNINYGFMLYESLRNYYSVNAAGNMTWLFKMLAAIVAPLQQPFNAYYAARVINILVAGCAWQIGQLTNVLNFLFDPTLARIYITQSVNISPAAPEFGYTTPVNAPKFGYVSPVGVRTFGSKPETSIVTFNVPTALSIILSQIEAVVAQVALTGIPYQFVLY